MSFTYDNTLAGDLHKVRFAIGDTVTPHHLVEDEEITALLATGDNPGVVAYKCARSIAARFARQADFAMDEQGVKLSQKSLQYERLANRLERESSNGGIQTIVTTKIDGYQPTNQEVDATDRSRSGVLHDFDDEAFDR